MKRHAIAGTDLELSTICLGGAGFGWSLAGDELDRQINRFRELGGNWLDSAHVYAIWTEQGAGCSERAIADYFRRNGGRDELIVATKGGLPSNEPTGYIRSDWPLSPEQIASDIDDSLGWLEADAIDLYYLHRDDERVDPGEIIETLNAEIRRGRIRHIGASNFLPERVEAANAYARDRGLVGFCINEPQWSLADADRSGEGGRFFLDDDAVAWHEQSALACAPYSPTSQGYFSTGEIKRDFLDTPLTRQRRDRACKLADELGCSPTQIALAYLMNHSFPVLPIVGTKDPEHLAEAVAAEEIKLSREEMAWLARGVD